VALAASADGAPPASAGERFRAANELARDGDLPAAIGAYRELAAAGVETSALYWNWGQAALGRGAHGEALWALLRGRELEPGDARLGLEIERVREAASLDPAEIAPEPLSALARLARRLRLGLASLLLVAVSLCCHALARRGDRRWLAPAAWTAAALGVALAAIPLAGSLARETAVVVAPDAPLLDAASPAADAVGTLREGEAVPILADSAGYLRVQDSSGARGWARASDVWPIGRPPRP